MRKNTKTDTPTQLNFEHIMQRANTLYAVEKTKHLPKETIMYMAPELFPTIQSDQVKCIVRALVEAINSNV